MRASASLFDRNSVGGRIIKKSYRHVYGERRLRFIAKIQARIPEYAHVMDALTEAGAMGTRGYPWRELDLLKVLDRVRPGRIVELGSGASTGVFAAWVRETQGASLLSYDHSQQWADRTRQALQGAGLLPHRRIEFQVAPMHESDRGSSYDLTLETGIDLLYVDGPPVLRRNGRSTANQDTIAHLDSGGRPGTIMIDDRVVTVDAVRIHPAAGDYSFTPGYSWLIKSERAGIKDLAAFFTYHRHSVFTRRADIVR